MFTRLLERPHCGIAAARHSHASAGARHVSSLRAADRSGVSAAPGHILVVEGGARDQQTILNVLRQAGHRISLSAEGIEGYRRTTALQPDLILLDVGPGVPTGLATARLLSADPSTSHIPVIFMTAGATLEERLESIQEGAVDCVEKPLEADELLMRVAVHLALTRRTNTVVQHPDQNLDDDRDGGIERVAYDTEKVLVQAALRIVEADLAKVPPLPVLAAQVGTHEKRLSWAFRAHTGQTVFEFVRAARLMRACTLLQASALSIDEVALTVGFSGAANFSTAFRARFGCTPSFYRKQDALSRPAPPSKACLYSCGPS